MAFNIRVYGILENDSGEILLSDERRFGKKFTKFPGGGLEMGEGLKECLKREFKEELDIDITVGDLFYLTDFYQQSAFNENDQLISIYYWVSSQEVSTIKTTSIPFHFNEEEMEIMRWKKKKELTNEDVTFPVDQLVVDLLINEG